MNDDPSSLHFRTGLLGVSSIAEKHAFRFGDQKPARTAGESAKISDVGEMRDQDYIQTLVGKTFLETLQARLMVHLWRV